MSFLIIYILSLIGLAKTLATNDFFSKKVFSRSLAELKKGKYYSIDEKFRKKYKVTIVEYEGKCYLMINGRFYKEEDFIGDYLIYKIDLGGIILKKENKYYIWIP